MRALETARLACAELGLEPTVHDKLSGGFDERDCAALLAGAGARASVLRWVNGVLVRVIVEVA